MEFRLTTFGYWKDNIEHFINIILEKLPLLMFKDAAFRFEIR